MTIDELIYVMADPGFFNLEIYDLDAGAPVYSGPADEVPDDLTYEEIGSIDVPTQADWLTVNISTEE